MTATLAPPLATQRFAVVDVETSGLRHRRHRILQLAVVTVLGDGTVVDSWVTTVRPVFGRVGPTHVHGLTRRSLRGAPSFAAVAPELVRRLDGAVFTAHNARFDWAFVRRGLERTGYPVPDAARLCTLRLSRLLDPAGRQSHRLADVAARHGVDVTRAHDALADATATAELLPQLLVEADIGDVEALAPHLEGHGTAWPPLQAAGWGQRVGARLRQVLRPSS